MSGERIQEIVNVVRKDAEIEFLRNLCNIYSLEFVKFDEIEGEFLVFYYDRQGKVLRVILYPGDFVDEDVEELVRSSIYSGCILTERDIDYFLWKKLPLLTFLEVRLSEKVIEKVSEFEITKTYERWMLDLILGENRFERIFNNDQEMVFDKN